MKIKSLLFATVLSIFALPVLAADLYVMQGSRMWVNSSSSAFSFAEQIRVGFGSQALCLSAINNMRTESLQQPEANGIIPAMKYPDPNYGSFRQLLAVQCLQVN